MGKRNLCTIIAGLICTVGIASKLGDSTQAIDPSKVGPQVSFEMKDKQSSQPDIRLSSSRNVYSGNMNLVMEVMQREYGITHASDSKTVLASYGAGPCVMLVGHEPNKKIGFIAHYDKTY